MKNNKFNAKVVNKMVLRLPSLSVNEGMARAAAAAFVSQLDPTATELADIKCAVSEAVTNCIVHGYRDAVGVVRMTVKLCEGRIVRIEIADKGCGIADVKQARQPLFTTDAAGERSGMGFTKILFYYIYRLERIIIYGQNQRKVLSIMTKKL